jgi:F-type H+-transporting ATPase subunit epsilon
MADTFLLEIVTPYRKLLSKEVEMVSAPAVQGEIGVLPGHTELLTLLGPGLLTYKSGADTGFIAMGRGYAEVAHGGKITVLVEEAEFSDEINVEDAKRDFKDAEEAMLELDPGDPAYKEAEYARAIAEAKLKAKGVEV